MLQSSLTINTRMAFFDPYNIYHIRRSRYIFTTNRLKNQVFKVWEEYEENYRQHWF